MYLRVIQTTSPSSMMRDMLVAYLQTNFVPWALTEGALSGRFVNIGENKGMLTMTYFDEEAAMKVQGLRDEDRQEIRKNHKLSAWRAGRFFFLEK